MAERGNVPYEDSNSSVGDEKDVELFAYQKSSATGAYSSQPGEQLAGIGTMPQNFAEYQNAGLQPIPVDSKQLLSNMRFTPYENLPPETVNGLVIREYRAKSQNVEQPTLIPGHDDFAPIPVADPAAKKWWFQRLTTRALCTLISVIVLVLIVAALGTVLGLTLGKKPKDPSRMSSLNGVNYANNILAVTNGSSTGVPVGSPTTQTQNTATSILTTSAQQSVVTVSGSTFTSTLSSSPTSLLPAGTSSSAPAPSNTATSLTILDIYWETVEKTAAIGPMLQQGPDILIDTNNENPWNNPDPDPGQAKVISVLHAFGTSIRTFVALAGSGSYNLVPGDVSLSPSTREITRQGPSDPSFAIVSVVWGPAEIRDPSVYQNIYSYAKNGSAIPFGISFFGQDTLLGHQKSAVIWYTEDNFKTVKSVSGFDGALVKIPL
jgi:hypothetical protein